MIQRLKVYVLTTIFSVNFMWKLLVWKAQVSIGDLSGMLVILAQPAHMKAITGQKTDKQDAYWIAK
ncbi:hypothetical protein ACPC58_00880 [Streptococcus sp. VTCC 12905]